MDAIRRALDVTLQWVVILLMIALTVVVIVAVFFRKFGASLSWYDEVASVLMAWVTYYGAAFAALRRGHLGFDGVLLRLPLGLRKAAVILAEAIVLGFMALLAWAGLEVLKVIGDESLVSLRWVPVAFTQSVIPIGATLFIIAELLSLPGYWRQVMEGSPAGHGPGAPGAEGDGR
jgi:TRAP-type C4-dicarboxylate transport system permease small subunit